MDLMILVAILILIASLGFSFWSSSQGYYDNYGKKIPLDEIKSQSEQQGSEIATLKEQLEAQSKKLEEKSNTSDDIQMSEVLQKLSHLEKRLENLEKKVL